MLVEVVVESSRKTLEESSSDEDIRQVFRTKESLMELDTKLGDFAETWMRWTIIGRR